MKPRLWRGKQRIRISSSRCSQRKRLKLSQLGMRGSNQSVEHVPHSRSQPDGVACLIHKTKKPEILNFMSRKLFLRLSLSAVALGAVTVHYTGFGRNNVQQHPPPPPAVT